MSATAEKIDVSVSIVPRYLLEHGASTDLEELCGCGVDLTIPDKRSIFDELASIKADVAELKKVVAGHLRITVLSSVVAIITWSE